MTNCGTNRGFVQNIKSKVLMEVVQPLGRQSLRDLTQRQSCAVSLLSSPVSAADTSWRVTGQSGHSLFPQGLSLFLGCSLSQCTFLSYKRHIRENIFKFRVEINYTGQLFQHSIDQFVNPLKVLVLKWKQAVLKLRTPGPNSGTAFIISAHWKQTSSESLERSP